MDDAHPFQSQFDRLQGEHEARRIPRDQLPVGTPLHSVIGASDQAVVFLTGALVYSNGVEVGLEVRGRASAASVMDGETFFSRRRTFALAVELADGRRHVYGREADGPDSALLEFHTSRGGGASSSTQLFLTPVPPADHLLVYFEWPALDIPQTMTRISTLGVDAAAKEVRRRGATGPIDVPGASAAPTTATVTTTATARPTATATVDVHLLRHLFRSEVTALVRTDFSDDAAWSVVVDRLTRPVDFDDPDRLHGDPTVDESVLDPDEFLAALEPADDGADDLYRPNVEVIDNPANVGLTPEQLSRVFAADEDRSGHVLLADARTMREARAGGELTAVYVDLSWAEELPDSDPGRWFRVTDREFASLEANLSIGNLSFEEFARSADSDGVYRG